MLRPNSVSKGTHPLSPSVHHRPLEVISGLHQPKLMMNLLTAAIQAAGGQQPE